MKKSTEQWYFIQKWSDNIAHEFNFSIKPSSATKKHKTHNYSLSICLTHLSQPEKPNKNNYIFFVDAQQFPLKKKKLLPGHVIEIDWSIICDIAFL